MSRRAAKKPIIILADDGSHGPLLVAELKTRYEKDYSVLVERSGAELRDRLHATAKAGHPVALVLGGFDTVEQLVLAQELYPQAKRGLLLDWGENRSMREKVMRVLSVGEADYFVIRPTAEPDERFHRAITQFLDEWWRLEGSRFEPIQIIADAHSVRAHEIADVLTRHDFPYALYRNDSEPGRALLKRANVVASLDSVVVLVKGRPLIDPKNVDIADAVGARTRAGSGVYDVTIVGGGPAGLSTAVSAASEGLRTALVERIALGGQAGTSSMIRNYLGFPRGLSGAELAARALDQAILFGTEMVYASEAVLLAERGSERVVGLKGGLEVTSRVVVIATGVSYRMLDVPGLAEWNGRGVFYGASASEAPSLVNEHVHVVGGGNSAGQAALYLARFAAHVTILVRSDSLADSMSDYLIREIAASKKIKVQYRAEIVDGGGKTRLEWIAIRDRASGETTKVKTAALFVLIGAEPFTDWLPAEIERDDWGYVITGTRGRSHGSRGIDPLQFETTMPGVFAVGDVRSGSVKRVASSVGDGTICVRLIHEYLATLQTKT
ncbi:MAG TPA: FAD-dependent oxidoreductase [Candidatus Eisenbacteria bacterium]|nr:FAD-dependent oxidoreductase [Candidatus Eisenbacteria bacterium]